MEEIKKQKIKVTCPECGNTFTTNIGWALANNGNLICRKCYKQKNEEAANVKSLNEAVDKLKGMGMNFEILQ